MSPQGPGTRDIYSMSFLGLCQDSLAAPALSPPSGAQDLRPPEQSLGGPPPAPHLWRFIGLLGFPSLYGGKLGPVPPWTVLYVHEGGSEVPLGVSETASEAGGAPDPSQPNCSDFT